MRTSAIHRRCALLALAASCALPLLTAGTVAQESVTPPEKFFGFQLGADRKIARWDKMLEYYRLLDRASDRVQVVDMGPSTMGHPFLLVIVSSPGNLAKLEHFRQVNAKLSDPRGLREADIKPLVNEGKAVVLQSMSLHATEIGGTQMAAELAFDLASRSDVDTLRILENVIFLMVPSFNPDGQIMVTDWYQKTLGTEFEGASYPSLYHKYAGHDNNRDAFQTNLVESQYMAKIMFRDWIPQAYIDHHHMGSYGARLYVPPYADPVRPSADPLVWREIGWYGGHIAYKEEEEGKSGIVNAAIYSGWGHFGFHWITPFHNIAGMLTESASARLATPLYVHPDQLRGGTRGLPEYEEQTTFPNPWPGGWWRLRDIVERQKISAWAALDLAARNKETVLWNAYLKASRQTERGANATPVAYIVPAAQHDPLTALGMIEKLLAQGVEVHRAMRDFTSGERVYGAGSFVVSMAQPKMGVVRWLLGRTEYPDNSYTRDRDGSPIRPYDMATDTMFEFMGVRVDPAGQAVPPDMLTRVTTVASHGSVAAGASAFRLDGRLNASYRAVNLLLDKGAGVRRLDRSTDAAARAGDFIVSGAAQGVATEVAKTTGVDFAAHAGSATASTRSVARPRVGMYQRYYGGNMDEGWTRLLFEQFGFPYTTLMDADIKAGNLESKFDLIVLPSDSVAMMTGERDRDARGRGFGGGPTSYPPEYRSGFGKEGVDSLEAFVQKGGTLLTFGEAGSLPIERFELPLRNAVADRRSTDFWCPGSTLRVRVDNEHPLGAGMPREALALFLSGSQAYEILPGERNEDVETVVTFADSDLLESGWLIGEKLLAKKAAMVSVKHGNGRVVLIGFRPQHRAQAHGTYKLVFNTLLDATRGQPTRPTSAGQ